MTAPKDDYLIRPDPLDPRLTERVTGLYGVRPRIEFVEIAALVDNAVAGAAVS